MSGLLCFGLLGLATASPINIDSPSATNGKVLNKAATADSADVSARDPISSWWCVSAIFLFVSTCLINAARYPNIDHSSAAVRDYVPFLKAGDDANNDYTTYIAVNPGDAAGFISALTSGGPNGDRDNLWLAGQPRTIYLPPGTYTLSETATVYDDTVIIGDAINPPTIMASDSFNGDYLIFGGATGSDDDNHGESHFSVMFKNIILDTTANVGSADFAALSWRVAQNSALVNVQINMPQGAHTGLYVGQGSTIQIADVTFRNGTNGIHYDGHQQATIKNMKFIDCTTGILIDGGNTINIFAPTFDTVGRSIVFNSGASWVSVIDANSTNSGDFFTTNVGYPNFLLENVAKDTTDSNMVTVNGNVKLDGTVQSVGSYLYGNTYGADPIYQDNPTNLPLSRNSVLAPNTAYPTISANMYTDVTIDGVINLKDSTQNGGQNLTGDGGTNDGPALQAALDFAADQGKLAYLPYGIYVTQQTITIKSGTRLIGNGWSTISGTGDAFTDETNPTPIVQIGDSSDAGTVDIQDIRFTVGDMLPGAIVLQINMASTTPGDVSIHNSLITIGGTRDTNLTCNDEAQCKGAYIGLHFTEGSSAYIDNFWNWVADHASDNSGEDYGKNIRIAAKTGVVIESTKGVWLSGLGSEHWWLAQLSYTNAFNVFVSLFQSETNYHQGTGDMAASVAPPAPWTAQDTDPGFSWCDGSSATCPMSAAQFWNGGSEIYSYASGSWNFYGGNQDNMNIIGSDPAGLHAYGLCDHEATEIMRLSDGTTFGNGDSDGFGGSWGTLVANFTI